MDTTSLKMVTIVAEGVLRDRVVRMIRDAGAGGYTVSRCEGEGSRGVRASDWEGNNQRFEVLCRAEVADKILSRVADEFFEHYAVIVWQHDVEVVRGDKYT